MKKLSQEDDLILLNKLKESSVGILSFREMAFFIFMIALYHSGYARWLFWVLIGILIILSVSYIDEYINHKTKDRIIEDELKRRGII